MILPNAIIFGACDEHSDSVTHSFFYSRYPWLKEYYTAASWLVGGLPALVDTVTRLRAGQSRDRKRPLLQGVQISCGALLASCSTGAGALSSGAKSSGRESDHSHLTSRLRIRGISLRSPPPTSSWGGV